MVEGMEEYPMHQAECITANIIIITARQQAHKGVFMQKDALVML